MAWRVARSLMVLRDEINAAYPNRSRASDGTIGDTAHQAQGSASDHNPWLTLYGDPTGIVTALDITHDPAHGCDIGALTDRLAATRDARIKYLIANGLILSGNGGPSPWVWRRYTGSDLHTNHFHLSVVADARCDDPRPWGITGAAPAPSIGGGDIDMATGDQIMEFLAQTIERNNLWPMASNIKQLQVEAAADKARDELVLAALKTGGGNPDVAATIAAVNAARDDLKQTVLAENAGLKAQLAAYQAKEAAAAKAAADALNLS